jgi:hypothetical protein
MAEWKRKGDQERVAKARKDSIENLLGIIESRAETQHLEAFSATPTADGKTSRKTIAQFWQNACGRRGLIGAADSLVRFGTGNTGGVLALGENVRFAPTADSKLSLHRAPQKPHDLVSLRGHPVLETIKGQSVRDIESDRKPNLIVRQKISGSPFRL